jgi:transposase-like protein
VPYLFRVLLRQKVESMSTRNRRTFSAKFKSEVVLTLLTGQKSQAEICRQHELSPALLAQWKDALLANASAAFISPDQRSAEAAQLAEMERLVGRLTWENDALKKGSTLLQSNLVNNRSSRTQSGGKS